MTWSSGMKSQVWEDPLEIFSRSPSFVNRATVMDNHAEHVARLFELEDMNVFILHAFVVILLHHNLDL